MISSECGVDTFHKFLHLFSKSLLHQTYMAMKIGVVIVNILYGGGGGGCEVQVAGHCFTITETTRTFTKMLTLGLNIIQSIVFGPNVSNS